MLLSDGFSLHRYFHTVFKSIINLLLNTFKQLAFVAHCVFRVFQTHSHSYSSSANLFHLFHILFAKDTGLGYTIVYSNSSAFPRDNHPTLRSYLIFPPKPFQDELAHVAAALHWELLCSWRSQQPWSQRPSQSCCFPRGSPVFCKADWRFCSQLHDLESVSTEMCIVWAYQTTVIFLSCEWPISLCVVTLSLVSPESFHELSKETLFFC